MKEKTTYCPIVRVLPWNEDGTGYGELSVYSLGGYATEREAQNAIDNEDYDGELQSAYIECNSDTV